MPLTDEERTKKRREIQTLTAALKKYQPVADRWSDANIGAIIRLYPDDWLDWFLEGYTEKEAEPFHAIVKYVDPYSDEEYEEVAAKVRWLLNLEAMIDWTTNELDWLQWQLWPESHYKPGRRRYERPVRELAFSLA